MNNSKGYFDGIEIKLWVSLWSLGGAFVAFNNFGYRGFHVRVWIFSVSIMTRWTVIKRPLSSHDRAAKGDR
jgi:hypothetical protein